MYHYVNYTIDLGDGGKTYQSGPYQSRREAEEHAADIKTYSGVSMCYVTPFRDLARSLVSS
jgi:hypothetical protein